MYQLHGEVYGALLAGLQRQLGSLQSTLACAAEQLHRNTASAAGLCSPATWRGLSLRAACPCKTTANAPQNIILQLTTIMCVLHAACAGLQGLKKKKKFVSSGVLGFFGVSSNHPAAETCNIEATAKGFITGVTTGLKRLRRAIAQQPAVQAADTQESHLAFNRLTQALVSGPCCIKTCKRPQVSIWASTVCAAHVRNCRLLRKQQCSAFPANSAQSKSIATALLGLSPAAALADMDAAIARASAAAKAAAAHASGEMWCVQLWRMLSLSSLQCRLAPQVPAPHSITVPSACLRTDSC